MSPKRNGKLGPYITIKSIFGLTVESDELERKGYTITESGGDKNYNATIELGKKTRNIGVSLGKIISDTISHKDSLSPEHIREIETNHTPQAQNNL